MRYTKDNPPDFKPAFASRDAWEVRAAHLRRRTAIALGLAKMPERPPVVATVHGKTLHDGYSVEKVFFASMPGVYVTGNLYRPANPRESKCPVVLHPYGHWPEGRFIWMSDEKIDAALVNGSELLRSSARSPLQACNATFARIGCVVFQYDMLGYCDSKQVVHPQGFDDADAILRSQGVMGLQTFNSIRALDFVTALPDVDAEQIAVGGASSGGTQTLMLGILDDRPKAMFIAGMIGMNMQGGCPCENAPLLRLESNNVELCATLAPRHVFCSGATGDWTHDSDRRGIPELKHIYQLYDSVDRIDGNVLPWPHNFNAHTRADFYAFVDRAFGLNSGEAKVEREFDPIPPAQLSVFDAHHPRPADEANIETIRETWRPNVSVKGLLDAWIGEITPRALELPASQSITMIVFDMAAATAKLVLHDYAADWKREIVLPPIEPMKVLKDKPEWFDFVFNQPFVIERACQILALALEVRSKEGTRLSLVADRLASPLACITCAARPGLFETATLGLGRFEFDQITAIDDPRFFPGALACGGLRALLQTAQPTLINGIEAP